MVFEHCAPSGWNEHVRWLTFCAGPHEDLPQPQLHVESLNLFAGADSGSAEQVLTQLCGRHGLEGEALAFWQRILDYVVEFCFISRRTLPPFFTSDRIASLHARPPPWVNANVLQAVARESLYDRYVVGPAVLPEHSESSGSIEGPDREVRAHWRCGHFRMQAHGPAAARRKPIFVMPVLVRADCLHAGVAV
jgi:hypothetical protein